MTVTDTFTFKVLKDRKQFPYRGVLSTVNSVFDPLGILAPVIFEGKSLLREFSVDKCDWDSPLPQERLRERETWRKSLHDWNKLHFPWVYTATSLSKAKRTELCVFSDVSTKGFGVVAYLRTVQSEGKMHVGFVLRKGKLAPPSQPTSP